MAADSGKDGQGRLGATRAGFIASLGRRLHALEANLLELQEAPDRDRTRRVLLGRVRCLANGARVLGFGSLAEALATVVPALEVVPDRDGLASIQRTIEALPTLIEALDGSAGRTRNGAGFSVSVLVLGSGELASALDLHDEQDAPPFELEHTEQPTRAHELARIVAPDVIVLDADVPEHAELVTTLRQDELVPSTPMVVVGSFADATAGLEFLRTGVARLIPKPVLPERLQRAVREAAVQARAGEFAWEPLGSLTIEGLAERLAAELKRAVVGSALGGAAKQVVSLGDGAEILSALWASAARIREQVTSRSGGQVRFAATGPESALPSAPWLTRERPAGGRNGGVLRGDADVCLVGRRILIADHDPAVVWFLSGVLRSAGAEVIEAHQGLAALELVYRTWPDLVMSDVLMPGLDGFALCHELKQDVALRDVPVILLSWKDDLLQRMRELGVTADGYLGKDAARSTVIERVREVLRPRARVEQRIASGGEVLGRLDGLTPRLVLQLACASGADVRVTVRDAAYIYEVRIRGGRPMCATRTDADGRFETGNRALLALLGVSAGRFVVAPDGERCRSDFRGSLPELLEEPIRAARAAQRALASDALSRVCRVDIDYELIAGYVDRTPESARQVLTRLCSGNSPRELMMIGDTPLRLLEAVLQDIARRGAVRAVYDIQDRDLLPDIALSLEQRKSHAPAPATEVARVQLLPVTFPEPLPEQRVIMPQGLDDAEPLFSFQLSPIPPDADARSARSDREPITASIRWPLNPNVTPLKAQPSREAAEPEPNTYPGLGTHEAAEYAELSDLLLGAVGSDSASPPAAQVSAPAAQVSAPAAQVSAPAAQVSAPAAQASVSAPNPGAYSQAPMPVSIGSVLRQPDVTPAVSISSSLRQSEAPPDMSLESEAPPRMSLEAEAPPRMSLESEAPPRMSLESEATRSAAPAPVVVASASVSNAPPSAAPALPPRASSSEPLAAPEPGPSAPEPSPEIPGMVSASPAPVKAEADSETPRPAVSSTRAPARENKWLNGARFGLTAAAAAAASFMLVRVFVSSPVENAPTENATGSAETAAAAPAEMRPPAAAKAVEKPIEVRAEELEAPEGVVLGAGKGMIEVETGGKQAIYVDGAFVGRGPLRRVPVSAGSYEVRTKDDNRERVDSVAVKAGKRMRLPLGEVWKTR